MAIKWRRLRTSAVKTRNSGAKFFRNCRQNGVDVAPLSDYVDAHSDVPLGELLLLLLLVKPCKLMTLITGARKLTDSFGMNYGILLSYPTPETNYPASGKVGSFRISGLYFGQFFITF